jgi:hypothetical protein
MLLFCRKFPSDYNSFIKYPFLHYSLSLPHRFSLFAAAFMHCNDEKNLRSKKLSKERVSERERERDKE